jgi:rhodanese-related sulfurtransferase/predicted metal-dependent enzyme (double-stranded beta helix superfamily)
MSVVTTPTQSPRPLSELATLVDALAARPQDWIERVRFRVGERWYERLERSAEYEVWAISWMPGQATGFHDHGGSAGAFAVVFGTLEEQRAGGQPQPIAAGQVRAFGPHDVHDVRNAAATPAVSIHAYSPPLSIMNRYAFSEAGLVPCGTVFEDGDDEAEAERVAAERTVHDTQTTAPRNIEAAVDEARARLQRVSPAQACEALAAGAVLVDIRPEAQRALEGEIPDAIVIERNVLEWRLDPESDARLPIANGYDLHIIVVCSAGYASSLAAASLQDIGLSRATDLIGGFQAWRAAGLPTSAGSRSSRVKP